MSDKTTGADGDTAVLSDDPEPSSPPPTPARDPDQDLHPLLSVYQGLEPKDLNEALVQLSQGHKLVVVFRGVLDPLTCETAVRCLETHRNKEFYKGDESVGRIGNSLYETQFGEALRDKYWQRADEDRHEARRIFKPFGAPVDALHAMCDELTDFNGAGYLRVDGRVAFAGLVRCVNPGTEIRPHNDCVAWDVPKSLECQQVDCQISANFYLSMPGEGGELTVYNRKLSKLEYDGARRPPPDENFLRQDALPTAELTVRPNAGDLVIFNAGYPHEVTRTAMGGKVRYTCSCFIGVCRDRSIVIFS